MKKYVKIYCDALGYDEGDFIPSEISGARAVDISHIIGKGRGGEDRIENLQALTRQEHLDYGEVNYLLPMVLKIHRQFLINNKIDFDNDWFEYNIKRYE